MDFDFSARLWPLDRHCNATGITDASIECVEWALEFWASGRFGSQCHSRLSLASGRSCGCLSNGWVRRRWIRSYCAGKVSFSLDASSMAQMPSTSKSWSDCGDNAKMRFVQTQQQHRWQRIYKLFHQRSPWSHFVNAVLLVAALHGQTDAVSLPSMKL